MKKRILKILIDKIKATPHDYYPTGIEGIPQSAREIADMVKAFTEWIIFPDRDITTSYRNNRLVFRDEDDTEFTFDGIFNYWYDNIRDK